MVVLISAHIFPLFHCHAVAVFVNPPLHSQLTKDLSDLATSVSYNIALKLSFYRNVMINNSVYEVISNTSLSIATT